MANCWEISPFLWQRLLQGTSLRTVSLLLHYDAVGACKFFLCVVFRVPESRVTNSAILEVQTASSSRAREFISFLLAIFGGTRVSLCIIALPTRRVLVVILGSTLGSPAHTLQQAPWSKVYCFFERDSKYPKAHPDLSVATLRREVFLFLKP